MILGCMEGRRGNLILLSDIRRGNPLWLSQNGQARGPAPTGIDRAMTDTKLFLLLSRWLLGSLPFDA
jgi:hypothetical protein